MPVIPTPFTILPTPPSTSDPANFDPRADAFLGALPTFQSQANDWGTTTYNNAAEAAANAAQAIASASSAASSAGAPLWVSGSTYTLNTIVRSPATLQVFYVKVASTSGTVDPSIDSTNWSPVKFTVDSLNGGQLGGFRNRLMNGQFNIDQRSQTTSTTPTGSAYPVDRWQFATNQSSKLSFQVVADAPPGFRNSERITVASAFAPAAGDSFAFQQHIEAANITDFAFGTSDAKPITLSFWVKSSLPATRNVAVFHGSGSTNRWYVAEYAVTTSWSKVVITIPGETTGTWPAGTSSGLVVRFDLGSGTNFNTATPNTWITSQANRTAAGGTFVSNTAATINFTGLQLELGNVATPFEQIGLGNELFSCQRYFIRYSPILCAGYNAAANIIYEDFALPQFMRTTPTVTPLSVSLNNTSSPVATPISSSSFRIQGTITATGAGFVSVDGGLLINADF